MMLFVTVGTSNYSFKRIFNLAEDLFVKNSEIISRVVLQVGHNQIGTDAYTCPVEVFKFTDRSKFARLLSEADIILTHGAAGTVLQCAAVGRKPFILPRQSSLAEHSDDHQVKSAATFVSDKLCFLLSGSAPKLSREVIKASRVKPRRLSGSRVSAYLLGDICA